MQRTVWARVEFQCGLYSEIEASAPKCRWYFKLFDGRHYTHTVAGLLFSPFPSQQSLLETGSPADGHTPALTSCRCWRPFPPTHSRLWLLRTKLQFILLPLCQELSKFIPQNMSDLCFYSLLLLIVLPVRFFFLIIDISIIF